MKLSEAIRLGAMLKPQAFYDVRHNGGTCALGAAYEAAGLFEDGTNDLKPKALIITAFPLLMAPRRSCHVCGVIPTENFQDILGTNIAHLNDTHRWTREQIADWVETIEPAEAPQAIERTPDAAYAWVQR